MLGEFDLSKGFPEGYGAVGWAFEIAPRNAAFGAPTTYVFAGGGVSIGLPAGLTGGSTNWVNFKTHSEQTVNQFDGLGAISVLPTAQIHHTTIWGSKMHIGFIHPISDASSTAIEPEFDSSEAAGFTAYALYAGYWFQGGALVC